MASTKFFVEKQCPAKLFQQSWRILLRKVIDTAKRSVYDQAFRRFSMQSQVPVLERDAEQDVQRPQQPSGAQHTTENPKQSPIAEQDVQCSQQPSGAQQDSARSQQPSGVQHTTENSQQSKAELEAEQKERRKIIQRSMIGGLSTVAIILLIAVLFLGVQAASAKPQFIPAPPPPPRYSSGTLGGGGNIGLPSTTGSSTTSNTNGGNTTAGTNSGDTTSGTNGGNTTSGTNGGSTTSGTNSGGTTSGQSSSSTSGSGQP
jgi:hypothetical protein